MGASSTHSDLFYGLARGPGVPGPPLTRGNEVLTAWSAWPNRPQDRFVRQRRVGVWAKGLAWSGLDASLCVARSSSSTFIALRGRCADWWFHEHVLQGPRASAAGSSAALPDAVGARE